MAVLGEMAQAQPALPVMGPPPANDAEFAAKKSRWDQFLAQPGVKAMLAQFGATMLTNANSGAPLTAQLGTAFGDAAQAGGRNVQAGMAQQQQAFEQQNVMAGRELQQQGLDLQGQQLEETKRGNVAAETRATAQDAATEAFRMAQLGMDAKTLALREKEMGASEAYRQAMLELDWAKMAAAPKELTPREKALIEVVKNSLTPEDAEQGKVIVDLMFPAAAPAAPGTAEAAPAVPSAAASAAPPAPQTRVPGDLDLPADQTQLKDGAIYYHPQYGRLKFNAAKAGFDPVM